MNGRRQFKRSELHAMVWEEALSKLAPKLGLSDVGLRKVCKRQNIPLPPQGFWARAPERRPTKRIPLPNPDKDWEIEFTIPPLVTVEGQSDLEAQFGREIAAESLPENRIIVSPNPDAPHAMTRIVAKALAKARMDDFGAVVCVTPTAFRVRVPPSSVDRAVAIIDALAKALDARGLAVEKGPEKGTARVRIGDHVLLLALEETSSRTPHELTEAELASIRRRRSRGDIPFFDFRPSGKMALKIENIWQAGVQSAWRDSASRKVEDRLNEVIVGLYRAAHAIDIKKRLEAERQRRVDIENARRAALRAERDDEVKFFNQLDAYATAWHRAEILRGFAAAVESKDLEEGTVISGDKAEWLARARRLADRVDPLTPNPPSPLDYADEDLRSVWGWQFQD